MLDNNQDKQSILSQLAKKIEKHHKGKKAEIIKQFSQNYYALVSPDDMKLVNIDNLYGAFISHFNFVYDRKPGETRIKVFNPNLKKDGWESTHTIIQISHDDMPFLVDSIRMEINRHGYLVHHIIHLGGIRLRRNKQHEIVEILARDLSIQGSVVDAPIYVEIDRQTDPKMLAALEEGLQKVLDDVTASVSDWELMLERLDHALLELEQSPPDLDPAEITESRAFLKWLKENFVFFGCRDYVYKKKGNEKYLQAVPGSGIGVFRDEKGKQVRYLSDLPPEARKLALSPQILIIAKTNTQSTIHRSGYTDYIGVKLFDNKGRLLGERRFIGLYTANAYNTSPRYIPFLRLKVQKILEQTNFSINSHAYKTMLNTLETMPRDDLFQASVEELYELSMGIFHLQERQQIRLFVRKDTYSRYYSCLVFFPRDASSNPDLIQDMQEILQEAFNATEISHTIFVTESVLIRLHFMVRVDFEKPVQVNYKNIEAKLIQVGMSWREQLQRALVNHFDEEQGMAYLNKYRTAFPASYREAYDAKIAAEDVACFERLSDNQPLVMEFFKPSQQENIYQFKVYQRNSSVPLSDALPILENMGFRVLGERPHKIIRKDAKVFWINDFDLTPTQNKAIHAEKIRETFQRAFAAIWLKKAENDEFNKLVTVAELNWKHVAMLRGYAKYFQQTGFTLSQSYIAQTLINNAAITQKLVQLFNLRFEPASEYTEQRNEKFVQDILHHLEEVANLDEDRILRRYVHVIQATLRTSFFQKDSMGIFKPYIAFKLKPDLIPEMPLPLPMFEIFVYSPRFEAVHLRGAKVSRGGLRWSDRREDFRTEVLGLMKAQQVKNAVIVPLGAKGGFVAKQMPVNASRDEIFKEGVTCYQLFINALLDITDNIIGKKVVHPSSVRRFDEDDPYLVVAADKGTATFSDYANAISKQHNFWLGDAFASGGSAGYDHKKMGITAKGAWESVTRHFSEMGVDPQSMPFTVVGIGDMSGDVFGNGMLLSRCIKLVAAFNHMHIFLDPNPDAAKSFLERQRLFNLPRSTWEDYNSKLISKGGGIFLRSAKSIKLTPEIKKLLDTKKDSMTPNELIHTILQAPVDLLWNGGIGTYVKASSEHNSNVGDRANDGLRVNGNQLRCKVVGEGGNLGLTQLARIEYALNGGRIFTDFIDNSAGVDCSDHEVNIKILLNQVAVDQQFTEKARNKLLAEMTNEVSELVLRDNYEQTLAISVATESSAGSVELYAHLIEQLVQSGRLNRELEFLPDEKALVERKANNMGLTRPEMAILFSYSKILLKEKIFNSDLPEDAYCGQLIMKEFPKVLSKKYSASMLKHSLRREIISTQLTNQLINQMGITFIDRIHEESSTDRIQIIKACLLAQQIFDQPALWTEIEKLDGKVPTSVLYFMYRRVNRLIRRAARALIRQRISFNNMNEFIKRYRQSVEDLRDVIPSLLTGEDKEKIDAVVKDWTAQGVPMKLAEQIAISSVLVSALDIIDSAHQLKMKLKTVAEVFFILNSELSIQWLRDQIMSFQVDDRWSALARSAFRYDIDDTHKMLAVSILKSLKPKDVVKSTVEAWLQERAKLINRWRARVAEMRAMTTVGPVVFSVALRDLVELARS